MSRIVVPLVTAMTVLLFAVAAHADEGQDEYDEDEYDEEEPATESAPAADPLTALLQSEVLRYYRGIGAEPTEAELKSALDAASDMVLADVAIEQISLAVDEAIRRHESGVDVPFAVAVPRFVRALAEEEARAVEVDASEAAQQPEWREAADQNIEDLRTGKAGQSPSSGTRDKKVGTGLMVSAFVAQGFGVAGTFAGIFFGPIVSGPIQVATIPFAPLGVAGFVLRFGGGSESERLRWAGIGLLEAAAYSGLVGGVGVALALAEPRVSFLFLPSLVAHIGASIAFGIAGGVCVGVAKAQARRQGLSESRRSPARRSHRGFVMPTIAPRPDGLSLGLAGVF